jgi:DNA helicase II / ATP-dependent DNA helicase PcrA
MVEALRQAGIPCRVFGEISFFKRADIKDLVAYLTWAMNPSDSIAINRVVSKPSRGLGEPLNIV